MIDNIEHELEVEVIADYLESIGNAQRFWYPATPAPGVREQLQRLVDAGLQLGVVSNSDGTIEKSLREAGVCQVGPVMAFQSRPSSILAGRFVSVE
jgi:phosphoglycolate phosphatase-like HAD superfamily hydrolase